jgi:hypothetical protein
MTTTQRAYCQGHATGEQTRKHTSRREAAEAGYTTGMTQGEADAWHNGHDDACAGDNWRRDYATGQTSMWEG